MTPSRYLLLIHIEVATAVLYKYIPLFKAVVIRSSSIRPGGQLALGMLGINAFLSAPQSRRRLSLPAVRESHACFFSLPIRASTSSAASGILVRPKIADTPILQCRITFCGIRHRRSPECHRHPGLSDSIIFGTSVQSPPPGMRRPLCTSFSMAWRVALAGSGTWDPHPHKTQVGKGGGNHLARGHGHRPIFTTSIRSSTLAGNKLVNLLSISMFLSQAEL